MKKKLHKLIVLFLLCSIHAAAQTEGYKYQASITPVDSSGFYNIVLTPQLNALLRTDYSDLRVVNDTGKWVPHLVRFPNEEILVTPVIHERKIVENENTSLNTRIIIEANADEIANLVLTIKNTAAKRYCTISGSDDRNSWFVINDSVEAIPVKKMDDNNSSVTFYFPPVNYKYFKVLINNNGKEPLKILSAGTEGVNNQPGKLFRHHPVENPPAVIFQKDSNKMSYIRIEQAGNFHFDKFSLKVDGVKYYNRFAELYIPASDKHSFSSPGKLVQVFHISNNSTLQYKTFSNNAKIFYIIIRNYDNLPLKIDSVKTLYGFSVATVYLEKNKQYKLLLNNDAVAAAGYDLKIADIPGKEDLPSAIVSSVSALKNEILPGKKTNNSKSLIWIVISIAAIVLGFFTYRLVKDMDKSKS